MEMFSQRENVLVGYNPKRPFKHSDIDFHDVFGGPPRRSSMQEMRYSLNSTQGGGGEEDSVLPLRPLSDGALNEIPVFGEETVNRQRYQSDDFFDDIFRVDESVGSPRRSNQDPFGSTPGSRVMSPTRPLLPRADFFSSSLSSQFKFSLPAKLTKSKDFPVSASTSRSPPRYKDPASNTINSLYTPRPPLSRLSSEASQEEDDLKNEIRQSYRPSPLSHEFSPSSKDLHENKSGELESTDIGSNLKKETKNVEAPTNNGQFHFSIYKWARKGVPLLMPLRRSNSTKSKERVMPERSSSSNGRIDSENLASGLEKTTYLPNSGLHFLNQSANDESPYPDGMQQDRGSLGKSSSEYRIELSDSVEEAVFPMAESKHINKIPNIVGNLPGNTISSDRRKEIKSYSLSETGFCGSTEKEIPMSKEETKKPELKPLHFMLSETVAEKGNDEISRKSEGKETVDKSTASDSNVPESENVKRHDEKRVKSSRVTRLNELHSPDSRKTSGDNLGRNRAKGKVKEFVNIFNQETVSKPKIATETRSQSSRWKNKGTFPADNEESANRTQRNETNHLHSVNKMRSPPSVSVVVDKNLEELENQQSPIKTRGFDASENSFCQKDISATSTESLHDGPKVIDVNIDDLFQENFMISDAKIRKWVNGKESNIRSLLSTLQYVLWPESGWKPVPLMDIIEGSEVKRAYQKALLCLHPDKLQQKGAASHQKYIAEKVFDVLQEAWDHINLLGAI